MFYPHTIMKTWTGLTFLLCGIILRTEGACHCLEGCDRGEEANCTACQEGWFGSYCQKKGACHCLEGCDRGEEANCTACQEGWFGSYCQKRNVALHGRAEQIDTFSEFSVNTGYTRVNLTADLAVDGNNRADAIWCLSYTCSHTDETWNAWWKVHLGRNGINQIRYITVYNHDDPEFESRNRGMEILVSGQTCYKWEKDEIPPTVSHVDCGRTLIGDEVTIRIPYKLLTLCEVQVFVCSDFWFGEDCDLKCQCLNSREICDKGSGHCVSGCPTGLTGGGCLQECENGTYGRNCSSMCGHCLNNDACNKTSGQCPQGCERGWTSDTCDTVSEGACHCLEGCDRDEEAKCTACQEGWFGSYCQKRNVALHGRAEQIDTYSESGPRTGHVLVNFTADLAVDGNNKADAIYLQPYTCSHTGETWNAWWKVHLGSNGINQIRYITVYNRDEWEFEGRHRGMEILVSGQTCYKWEKDEIPPTVSHVDCGRTLIGDEVTIRIPYKWLSLCEVQVFVCSDFWFGEDCDLKCQCLNSSEICDKGSGHCVSGCPVGLTGGSCLQVCENGMYGRNCSSVCGHCLNNDACNKISGQCPQGCERGWTLDTCNTEQASTDVRKGMLLVTGIIVAVCCGFVVVVLALVVAFLVCRLRRERLQSIKERYAGLTPDTTEDAVYYSIVQ